MEKVERGYLEDAMSHLAGLEHLCKLLLLRVGQIKTRAPSLNGLVEPMDEEIVEIMQGIRETQEAYARIWRHDFMK